MVEDDCVYLHACILLLAAFSAAEKKHNPENIIRKDKVILRNKRGSEYQKVRVEK